MEDQFLDYCEELLAIADEGLADTKLGKFVKGKVDKIKEKSLINYKKKIQNSVKEYISVAKDQQKNARDHHNVKEIEVQIDLIKECEKKIDSVENMKQARALANDLMDVLSDLYTITGSMPLTTEAMQRENMVAQQRQSEIQNDIQYNQMLLQAEQNRLHQQQMVQQMQHDQMMQTNLQNTLTAVSMSTPPGAGPLF